MIKLRVCTFLDGWVAGVYGLKRHSDLITLCGPNGQIVDKHRAMVEVLRLAILEHYTPGTLKRSTDGP